jgi:O-antigen/teichoic acid export membrane protein
LSTASPAARADEPRAAKQSQPRSYGSGARILSIGIASTGVLTFAYFSVASHVLSPDAASRLNVLWSVMFVIISVIYRPIEQLLSRSIADRRARGLERHTLIVPIAIQASFALIFLAVALPLHHTLVAHVFNGYATLYWVLVIGTLAYAASYFARGWLAGHQYFALYGGLVFMEASSRIAFVIAVALGIAHGQSAVAMGIAAAPFVSLVVVPAAFARQRATPRTPLLAATNPIDATEAVDETETIEAIAGAETGPAAPAAAEPPAGDSLSIRGGTRFAVSVSGIMLAEQALLNAAVLTVDATSSDRALAGIVFNVLLITRAPLQLFQAIQTSLLPHLAGLEVTKGSAAFGRAIRTTILAISGFAGAVALGLLAIGPFAMRHLFGQHYAYDRFGLALIAVGMGLHLTSGALNQAALARGRAAAAAATWLAAAAVFVVWMVLPVVGSQMLRVELGYSGAAGLLAAGLTVLYRKGARASGRM